MIVLSIATALSPRVLPAKRSEVTDLGDGIYQVILRYGFMEDPDVMQGLREAIGEGRLAVHSRDFLARYRQKGLAGRA